METERSLRVTKPATCSYFQPDQSSSHHSTPFFEDPF